MIQILLVSEHNEHVFNNCHILNNFCIQGQARCIYPLKKYITGITTLTTTQEKFICDCSH